VLVGSPHFMSPEQIRGASDVDARADVWGLGVLTFVMLTGRRPFEGGMAELAIRIGRGERPVASELVRSLPRGVDDVLDRALAPDREQRFATVTDLAEALERVAAAAIVAPVVRESLDSLPPISGRPSQRPTLVALEPVRDLMPTPVQPIVPSRPPPASPHGGGAQPGALVPATVAGSPSAMGIAAPPGLEEADLTPPPLRWPRIVAALAGMFLLLLAIALAWTP
jgi:serine/threonine-protein kinase